MSFQSVEVNRPTLQPQEDLTFLLEHYRLKAFHYCELQQEQAVLAALTDWPLLNETLRPLLQVTEAVNLVKAG